MPGRRVRVVFAAATILAALTASCVVTRQRIVSSTLDFLYPAGAAAIAPSYVELQLPVRVGIAFAPEATLRPSSFTEDQKQALLESVADAMRARDNLASIQVVPSTYLEQGGGFGNLDRLKAAFGIDVITLLSYDQIQFSDTTRKSWAYWTLIGAYVVKGEKNETRTMLNAVIYDIPSRALLFQATGQSSQRGRSTLVGSEGVMRRESDEGFDAATADLIAKLDTALDAFAEQAKTGTVRGEGTPAIEIRRDGTVAGGGGFGAGAVGPLEAAGALLLLIAAASHRRRSGRR